ncbi:MAG: TIGR03619 family F420-dependent LLM class oxidoreductase [Gammaproteobacteria bacterium]|nr:TIGR03619 family F420-dependent LLM class oxidoreductase [Gammaproteobacteria bacterium]
MNIGLCIPLIAPYASPEYIRVLGQSAEELGFSTLWIGEHVVLFDEYDSRYPLAEDGKMPGNAEDNVEMETFTSLAFLAAHTRTIRLGTGVCVLPQRNPVYTAKEVSNVDWLSNGRLTLGLGVGWLAEEYAAVGASFEKRGARCDSYLEVMKRLWCDKVSSYEDEFYHLPECRFYPKPVQQPYPPIVFGGNNNATFRRVASEGGGWYALGLNPQQLSVQLGKLDDKLKEHGRSRQDISIYACPYPHEHDQEMIRQYHELGVDEVILLDFAASTEELETLLKNLTATYIDFVKSL